MKRRVNPWSFLGMLSILAVLSLVTGDNRWDLCLLFWLFAFIGTTRVDERLKANFARAGLDCLVLTMLGLMVLILLSIARPSLQVLTGGIVTLFVLISLLFPALVIYHERRGA